MWHESHAHSAPQSWLLPTCTYPEANALVGSHDGNCSHPIACWKISFCLASHKTVSIFFSNPFRRPSKHNPGSVRRPMPVAIAPITWFTMMFNDLRIQNTVEDLSPVTTQQVLTNVIHGDPSHEESLQYIPSAAFCWPGKIGLASQYWESTHRFHPFASILPHCTVNPCVYKPRYNLSQITRITTLPPCHPAKGFRTFFPNGKEWKGATCNCDTMEVSDGFFHTLSDIPL